MIDSNGTHVNQTGDAKHTSDSVPPLTVERRDQEPEYNATGLNFPNQPTPPSNNGNLNPYNISSLDRHTEKEGILQYWAVFSPTVAPFKRSQSRNLVFENYEMGVVDKDLKKLTIKGVRDLPDRDQFWGSVLLDFKEGTQVPLPSVSPDMEIQSFSTEPKAQLEFFKDSADNYFVRARRFEGTLRLVFLADAPIAYFGGVIPEDIRLNKLPRSLIPNFPDEIMPSLEKVLKAAGVNSEQTLARQLNILVTYFRNFEPTALETKSNNIYLDIALSQKGVCRHRALSYVITTQGIGLPSRFIYNEAHAFAETYLPDYGWIRVDLGGGAEGLAVYNASEKNMYTPETTDPFSTPDEYDDSYSAVARNANKTDPDSTDTKTTVDENEDIKKSSTDDVESSQNPPIQVTASRLILYPPEGTVATGSRGKTLSVKGKLTKDDRSILADTKVEVVLIPRPEAPLENSQKLGELTTNEDGIFWGDITIPETIPLGRWEVIAIYKGTDQILGSRSDVR